MQQTDFGLWGFALSVLALVLIIPLGIVVNILSPKVQNWWATTSQKRLLKRITELKRTIDHPPSVLMSILNIVALLPLLVGGVLLTQLFQMVSTSPDLSTLDKLILPFANSTVFVFLIFASMSGLLAGTLGVRIRNRCRNGEEEYVRKYVEEKQQQLDKLLTKVR